MERVLVCKIHVTSDMYLKLANRQVTIQLCSPCLTYFYHINRSKIDIILVCKLHDFAAKSVKQAMT